MEPGVEQASAMLQHSLYADMNDLIKHFREMRSIADDMQRPIADIVRLYEEVLEYVGTDAKVTDFLLILVSKKVRERCRRNH